MIKIIVLITSLLFVSSVSASVNLPWSTTFNCDEWTYGDALTCNDLSGFGNWACTTDTPAKYEQITSGANNSTGYGGRGQRHWIGDDRAINSGGLSLEFNSVQTELWIRWYMRYQAGFSWSELEATKWLYVHTNTANGNPSAIAGFYNANGVHIFSQGTNSDVGDNNPNSATGGWQDLMGGATGDGKFHAYEIHIKMDIDGTDGIGEMWIDGTQLFSASNVNWGYSPEIAAPGAAIAALVETESGNLSNGDYKYKVTFVNYSSGETTAGTVSNTVTADSTHKQVNLSSIPTSASNTIHYRKVYRTVAGGATYYLLTTIEDNTTTTYADNVADASLPATEPPASNTTAVDGWGWILIGSNQALPANGVCMNNDFDDIAISSTGRIGPLRLGGHGVSISGASIQ